MSSVQKVFYTVAHSLFYESLDHYQPDKATYLALVKGLLAADWEVVRKGVWFHAVPKGKGLAAQGWKIHVSATQENAERVLSAVVPVLVDERTPFKFGLDRRILSIMTGKAWHRGGAGKFVTIYPDDERHFVALIERLHQGTRGLAGPYILSDRRYRDSRVLYYRFGGLLPTESLSSKGEKDLMLSAPDGTAVPDERQPYFVLPPWVADPLAPPAEEGDGQDDGTLKAGRYQIDSVLTFSNSGGVYLATDRSDGSRVVIKEARPFTNVTPSGDDAVALLAKEHRFLRRVEQEGIAPRPVDFFTDWEHSYLVEEYLGDVPTLRYHASAMERNILLMTRPTTEAVAAYWADLRRVFRRLAEMVEVLHRHGIVFMDLSMNNVLVLDGGRDLKLVDFEGAFEPDVEEPTYIFTPGFASYKDMVRQEYRYESDYYSFGTLLLAYLIPVNGMLAFDPTAHLRFAREICADFRLPSAIVDAIGGLMAAEPADRLSPRAACDLLEQATLTGEPPVLRVRPDLTAACAQVVARTAEHLVRVATPERVDRLFPADPKVFVTNPLGVAYGACGVAYALRRIAGEVDPRIVDWILKQPQDEKSCPPGLYMGLSGVAWSLWELGHQERALAALAAAASHPRLASSPDVFYGASGYGIAALKFFARTGDDRHLDAAVGAAQVLARSAQEEEDRLFWPGENGEVSYGFAHGSSGIAVFLLYLHAVTGDEKWLSLGRRALDFDLAAAETNAEGAFTWRMSRRPGASLLPYLRYGTAGVGVATARYYRHLRDERYRAALDALFPDTDRKYAIFPGRFIGLAGIGEFLLDLRKEPEYEERAQAALERLVTGLLLFQVESADGLAFPGYELFRLSCDLGTGSAGIALFLHRYLTDGPHEFLADELLEAPAAAAGAGRPFALTNGTHR